MTEVLHCLSGRCTSGVGVRDDDISNAQDLELKFFSLWKARWDPILTRLAYANVGAIRIDVGIILQEKTLRNVSFVGNELTKIPGLHNVSHVAVLSGNAEAEGLSCFMSYIFERYEIVCNILHQLEGYRMQDRPEGSPRQAGI